MTTNVFDGDACELASDSRWSIKLPHAIVYVDDTGFDKLIIAQGAASMFAGNSEVIGEWKKWIADPQREDVPPDPDDMTVCVVDVETGKIVVELGQAQAEGGSRFAGSGGQWALPCWLQNRNARKAVETAKLADICSGGAVKFLEAKTGAHNLSLIDDVAHLRQELQKRGMVMYLSNLNQAVPLSEASNDAAVQEAVEKIAAGQAVLTAPCPSINRQWTSEEKQDLFKVMLSYYPPGR